MKTYQSLLFILLLSVFTSCNNDDDNSNNNSLSGEWNLTNISGGLAGIDLDFENGMILWTFNESTSMVTVVNNTTNGFTIFESGTYAYAIETDGEYDILIINEINLGAIEVSQNTINIDQRVLDGFLMVLER